MPWDAWNRINCLTSVLFGFNKELRWSQRGQIVFLSNQSYKSQSKTNTKQFAAGRKYSCGIRWKMSQTIRPLERSFLSGFNYREGAIINPHLSREAPVYLLSCITIFHLEHRYAFLAKSMDLYNTEAHHLDTDASLNKLIKRKRNSTAD